jgi:hypothetical protein
LQLYTAVGRTSGISAPNLLSRHSREHYDFLRGRPLGSAIGGSAPGSGGRKSSWNGTSSASASLSRPSKIGEIMIRKIAIAAALALIGTAAQANTFNVVIGGSCTKFILNVGNPLVAGMRYGCTGDNIEGGTVATVDNLQGVVVSEMYMGIVLTFYFATPTDGAGKVYITGSTVKPLCRWERVLIKSCAIAHRRRDRLGRTS